MCALLKFGEALVDINKTLELDPIFQVRLKVPSEASNCKHFIIASAFFVLCRLHWKERLTFWNDLEEGRKPSKFATPPWNSIQLIFKPTLQRPSPCKIPVVSNGRWMCSTRQKRLPSI